MIKCFILPGCIKKHNRSCANKLCHNNSYSKIYFLLFPIFCKTELSLLFRPFYAAFSLQLTTINTSALFVRQSYPKYPNCHISASICPFDPISSPFLICMILASIFMRCKLLWDWSFWLHFYPSALFCVSMVPQMPKVPYLIFYLSVWPHVFTIPHLYDPCKNVYAL